ncbi:hypothetical protein [Treponema socranskii]|uniref:hypothetical protein n=1 Tax=Treponema socranskii TaxID=53419 RepID=UPI003D6EC77E
MEQIRFVRIDFAPAATVSAFSAPLHVQKNRPQAGAFSELEDGQSDFQLIIIFPMGSF